MTRGKFAFYLTVFGAVIIIIVATLVLYSAHIYNEGKEDIYDPPPLGSDCVTHIKNEYGEIRLTDTIGYAFEFELNLYRSYPGVDFEIPLWGEYENRLIVASTMAGSEFKPKIYVNGIQKDTIPTSVGRYKIRLDVSHITGLGYSAGNRISVTGFGKIDLLCMY